MIYPSKKLADEFSALQDINLEISQGQTLGIVCPQRFGKKHSPANNCGDANTYRRKRRGERASLGFVGTRKRF